MSQTTLSEKLPSAPLRNDEGRDQRDSLPVSADLAGEMDYQPMPLSAPVALFLGIAAFSGLMGLFGLGLAVVGILVSLGSWLQIKASKGQYSGSTLALVGGGLSGFFLVLGSYFMISDYRAELPPGYQRVNFPNEIAEKGFLIVDGRRELHPDVKPFVDQPIFIKGYMWDSGATQGSFILLKDNGKCCFGGSPAPNDMIEVRVEKGMTVTYISGLVAVAGTFRANPDALPNEPVYVMEAQHVDRAKTVF